MTKFWNRVTMTAAAVSVAVLVAGTAYGAAHAMHEARVKAMKEMGGHMGAIGKVAKGEMEYSPETVTHAEALAKSSHELLTWFPEGSMGGEDSRAKKEIWTDWAGFEAKAKDFEAAAAELVAATKTGDKAKIGAALGATGKTCGGCHKTFRAEEKKS